LDACVELDSSIGTFNAIVEHITPSVCPACVVQELPYGAADSGTVGFDRILQGRFLCSAAFCAILGRIADTLPFVGLPAQDSV
jgi:hypothetical protein